MTAGCQSFFLHPKKSPKNLFQEHIGVCKKYPVQCPAACGAEVPREKVCLFVCSPVTPIYFVFKNHTENVKLKWLHYSNLSDYSKVA